MTYQLDDNTIAVGVPEHSVSWEILLSPALRILFYNSADYYGRPEKAYSRVFLPSDFTNIVGTVKTMSEDECAEFVEPPDEVMGRYADYTKGRTPHWFFDGHIHMVHPFKSSRDSLISRLKSVGAYLKNPYGEKEPKVIPDLAPYTTHMRNKREKWKEAEKNTFNDFVIIKK